MDKEELMLKKRLIDLSNQAFQRDIAVFSDFLNLNEQNILHTLPKNSLFTSFKTFGGYELAERKMAVFFPENLYYEYAYPFQAVVIRPLNVKFAEKLSHRDYLGSLMNLGLERSKFGDIIVNESSAIVFTCDEIADYMADSLTCIRHTSVSCEKKESVDISYTPEFTDIKGTVPSVRLDTVMSVAFPLSRSKLSAYIEAGKVFVNGKLITSNGYRLETGDIISVRGMGRICYQGILSETKKGRYYISVRKYI